MEGQGLYHADARAGISRGRYGERPEPTSIHCHWLMLPAGMDGVSRLNQPGIPAGKTFVHELAPLRPGSHIDHSHLVEQLQLAMGLYGSLVVGHRQGCHCLADFSGRAAFWLSLQASGARVGRTHFLS